MDENRTHPGRLNSAPQTVLKTAVLMTMAVRQCPLKMEIGEFRSADIRPCARAVGMLAVIMAVK